MAFEWLNNNSRKYLIEGGYLSEGEVPEQRIRDMGDRAEEILQIEGYSDKFYNYASKGWISPSSPIWGNFSKERGMPISCFSSKIMDNTGDILYGVAEVGMMSKLGGGTSGYFGEVRPRGSNISDNGKTSGVVHFMELFQSVTNVISQGGMRRGYMAGYLPADHGDILEFLDVATEGNPIQSMNTGVTFKDDWMNNMKKGDTDKRKVWAKTLQRRTEIGYPYIGFYDNMNRNKPDVYKDKGMEILNSNLCSEILLPVADDESFVCNLASVNMLHYDDWKDTDLIETVVFFLDAVMTEFIEKLEGYRDSTLHEDRMVFEYMKRAYNFAKRHRALGLGVLAWASYLQSNMVPFVSDKANELADDCFKNIQEQSYAASRKLADMFGEPELLKGYGRRNTTLNAIAPTTSSAFILGQVSQSIEPLFSNCYVKDIAKAKVVVKNPFLKDLLEEKGINTKETWDKIAKNDGSVLGIDELTDEEKQVFLTFDEIDAKGILEQAAIRQQYIDQGQSLNLKIPASYTAKQINEVTLYAWELGLPTLYYQHSTNAAQQFLKGICGSCEA